MRKRILFCIVLGAFAVCAVAVAQQRKAVDEARFGTVEVMRTESRVMRPAGVLVIPWHVNYQGYLTDDVGNPINDTLSMRFSIWDAASVGTELWNETQNTTVQDGIFNVILGSITPIPSDVFGAGASRWLELEVETQTLSPRTEITSVGYAYRSVKTDSADYADVVDGFDASIAPTANDLFPVSYGDAQYVNEGQADAITSSMILDGTIVRGDADPAFKAPYADTADYALSAPATPDNDWAITGNVLHPSAGYGLAMRSSNMLYGLYDTSHVNLGIACTTGTSGQNRAYCTVSGGYGNTASYDYASVAGGSGNSATGYHGTVGGGENNSATGQYTSVGGGRDNTVTGNGATVGGGGMNTVDGGWATLVGGWANAAAGDLATVGGGQSDTATAHYGGVLSGYSNLAGDQPEDTAAVVAGGWENSATGRGSFVGGGRSNTAGTFYATVGGGDGNTASGQRATVSGGGSNSASGDYAAVGGGYANTGSGGSSTVAGGGSNTASAFYSTVGGGHYNAVSAYAATVGGGYADTVAGDYSVGAGRNVVITGAADHTFAFGRDFTTSTPNAVIFHNSVDSVRVGVGVTNPTHYIDVDGGAYCSGTNWVNASSREYKKDITALGPEAYREILEKLAETEVVRFRYRTEGDEELHIGVIAEDAPEEMVDSERKGVPTGDAIGFLLAALKAQQERIEVLEDKIESME